MRVRRFRSVTFEPQSEFSALVLNTSFSGYEVHEADGEQQDGDGACMANSGSKC